MSLETCPSSLQLAHHIFTLFWHFQFLCSYFSQLPQKVSTPSKKMSPLISPNLNLAGGQEPSLKFITNWCLPVHKLNRFSILPSISHLSKNPLGKRQWSILVHKVSTFLPPGQLPNAWSQNISRKQIFINFFSSQHIIEDIWHDDAQSKCPCFGSQSPLAEFLSQFFFIP